MALVVVAYALPTALFGESIPANHGLGYDGTVYASIASRFGHLVRAGALDSYDVWRALPCGVVWFVFRVFGIATTPHHLMLGFRLLNLVELVAAVYVLHLICRRLSFSVPVEWFAFLGVFGSFFALKWNFFDPVLVDCSGFFLAMVLLWAFLDDRPYVVAGVTLLGAFTWPMVFVAGLVLLACPRAHQWGARRPSDRIVATSISLAVALVAFVVLRGLDQDRGLSDALRAGLAPQWRSWALVSALIAAAWVGAGLYPIVAGLLRLRAVRVDPRRLIGAALVTSIALSAHVLLTENPDPMLATARSGTSVGFVLRQNVWTALGKPGIFALGHVVFFGPVVLLAVFAWPRVVEAMRTRGLALVVLAGMAVVLCLDAESRHLVDLVPLVVIFTTAAIQRHLRPPLVVGFAAVTLAASKVWLPINHGGFPYRGTFFDFPAQYLFMNAGDYMSGRSYEIQGSVVLVAALGLAAFLVASRLTRDGSQRSLEDVSPSAGGSRAG